jgi:hypothetical protein
MEGKKGPSGQTDSRLDSRYLFIGGGTGAGGWFTKLGPNKDVSIPVPSVAPVHLPLVGGLSEAKSGAVNIEYERLHFPGIPKKLLGEILGQRLFSVKSAKSSVRSSADRPNKRFQVTTYSEVTSMKFKNGFALDFGKLNMESLHTGDNPFPAVHLGPSELSGLRLGKKPLKVTLDVDSLNRYPTLDELEKAFAAKKLPRTLARTLAVDESGRLYKSKTNYVVGSIVKSIEGDLPPGAYVEKNGYTINWPDFGKIVLGEILITPYMRRAALVRLKLCDFEAISGCSGGSSWP